MLGPIRKFSSSIYAKILLTIIIIPFIFWGMGSSLTGGNKNIVVTIDGQKYTVQEFSKFINNTATQKVQKTQIDQFLSSFIGEILLEKEIESFGINLSDKSLRKLIKAQKNFRRDNKFSRVEYEKFLIKNNITAARFEEILSKEEKKKQLLDLIGGGIKPSNFLVNISYNKNNQKRYVELLDLNKAFAKYLNFKDNEIKNFYEKNEKKYFEINKSLKVLELNPKKLIGINKFNDLFFKKIDQIDDLIIAGQNIDTISQSLNLGNPNILIQNENGKIIKSDLKQTLSNNLKNEILKIEDIEPTLLIEDGNKYFIVELSKVETVQKTIANADTKKEILSDLNLQTKSELTLKVVEKINDNNFNKLDFYDFAKKEDINIQKIKLSNVKDNKILRENLVYQIYSYPENKVIVARELDFSKNFLVYIDKIENVDIKSENDHEEYFELSKIKIVKDLYNSYDAYLNKKYKIDINYQTIDTVKNYFN